MRGRRRCDPLHNSWRHCIDVIAVAELRNAGSMRIAEIDMMG
jgi:hypothetical protein